MSVTIAVIENEIVTEAETATGIENVETGVETRCAERMGTKS